ncbi:MAG: transposase [Treponema sp.]|nr:transposase [Treponema sp.]MBD5440127.1 transposase [Treponema sp.]
MPIIQGLILEYSTIYTDGWKAYDGLVPNSYEHYRVFHSENRVRVRKEPCQRNRELLELRQEAAGEAQWLQFRCFRATLEGVRVGRHNHRHEDLLPPIKKLYRRTYLD